MMAVRLSVSLAISLVVVIGGGRGAAQQTSTVTANQLRLDLRVLGHPPVDVIPPGESAITSLTIGSDGFLYGGTSGTRAQLFQLDPKWGHVYPLGFLPGEESIFHSLAAGDDGAIYIGTSLLTVGAIESRGRDVLERYAGYAGGHLYRFDPAGERATRPRMRHPQPGEPLGPYEDLGVPIPGQGIVHLLAAGRKLFGVTFPDGHFFVTDLETGETEDKGSICGPPLSEEPFRSIPRAMVIDDNGLVWGAGDYGALFHYDPEADTITHHPQLRLPSELGREFKTILDAMVLAPDGTIYGGTSDGFLFRFDPTRSPSPKIINLGKPMWQYRIRGLAFSQDGDLYGVGGERGGAARLFVYRTAEGGYENLGLLDVNRSPYYTWLAFEAEAMVAGPDGTIFIGESGRISHLYLLYPWR